MEGHVKRVTLIIVALVIGVISVTALNAHDQYRIVGTVTKITADEISVKQVKDGKVIEMDITKQTKVTRDKKPVAMKDVKVGGNVVVDALGDSILDLEVIEIRLVPSIPTAKKFQ
jgi:hypothetical protein